MQSVNSAWTAEEKDLTRRPAYDLQISWHNDDITGNRTFTIGVSTIGGADIIGANAGAIGSPSNYRYFNETAYLTQLAWERGLNMPIGGLSKGLANATLSNVSDRFTPNFMGGRSELYTAIQVSKPSIISAGFNFGVDQTIPQFSGVINKQPKINIKNREAQLAFADYVDFFQNKKLDQSAMVTSQRTDQIMENLLQNTLGMSTSQYDLDTGLNTIPFAFFEKGSSMADIFGRLAAAEAGHFYQDESGIFKFENRQHWYSSPYTDVQRIITTSQVINAEGPNTDHIINVVEVKGSQYVKRASATLITDTVPHTIAGNSTLEIFYDYETPVLEITTPTAGGPTSSYLANSASDGSGSDQTSSVSIQSIYNFSTTSKITFKNNSASTVYLTSVIIGGRAAELVDPIYQRTVDSSSVTAFQEKPYTLTNDYVQNQSWAESYAQMILDDYSDPENLQSITIRAIPELQLGDLISWQGHYWRVYYIRATLDPSVGFIQELTILKRDIVAYFKIGISSIGGSDQIAS